MHADTWLRIATADLPEPVAERVARDTREHLEDAALGAGADVDPLLGPPEATAQELRRLYLTREEWEKLTDARRSDLRWVHLPLMALLGWRAWEGQSPVVVVAALAYILSYALSWRLHPLRQHGVLLLLGVLVNALLLTLYLPDSIGSTPGWAYACAGGMLAWQTVNFWKQDRRLRHTLQVAG